MTPVLSLDAHGRLTVTTPDGELHDLSPVRCFPFTDPDRFIALVDPRGHEQFRIDEPRTLPEESRHLLERELSRREFVPVIQRVREISPRSEPSTWDVQTDRGDVRFVLPSEDNIRRLPGDGALVTDEHGVRYRLVRISTMDKTSRELLIRYL